jgi:AraC-like DNA-binding protein
MTSSIRTKDLNSRRKCKHVFNPQKKNSSQSDKVVEYVLTRKIGELETLSVESVSKDLKIKRNKLWRGFKAEKELTPEEYIFRIKITRAAFLLEENDELTVKEIGEKVGYYDYNYFISIFKQYFGTTPGRYRKLKKK